MNDTTPAPAQAPHPGTVPPAINSAELLAGTREVLIQHGAETYRLKLTSSNKLILTK